MINIFSDAFCSTKKFIAINSSWKFVPKGPINNILALVQIMAINWINDGKITDEYLL